MKKKSVLIASPVQQSPEILKLFLESLMHLNADNWELSYLFVDDNHDQQSKILLQQFQPPNALVFHHTWRESSNIYQKDEHTHYWDAELMNKVGMMKDWIIEQMLQYEYDALFLIDSDLLIHPDTLNHLISADKEIISKIFWTKWNPDSVELPQVWQSDQYSFVQRLQHEQMDDKEKAHKEQMFIAKLRIPGIYEVGGLGACTLINRSALMKGVRFERIPNLSFWGEDRHFCVRAAALGIPLYVDTRKPAYHIYRESDLEKGKLYMEQNRQQHHQVEIEISLCMIVKNEERSLTRCLHSVRDIVDEIIIVDTGSSDKTKEIAASFQAIIYDFDWIDDFAAARNFSFSKATKEYILWLDADDVLEAEDYEKLKALKSIMPTNIDTVTMDYHLAVKADGTPLYSLKRNRLVKRNRGFRWIGAVHEYLEVHGVSMVSDIAVTHYKDKQYTDRNLQIYRRKQENMESFTPRDMYYYANELKDHGLYEEAIEQYERYLATELGWIEDRIASCFKLADCYGFTKQNTSQLRSLLRSLELEKPRAEFCCRIGSYYLNENQIYRAIFWYETATRLGDPPNNGAIIEHAAWTWLPYLQLCVCYDRLGNPGKAYVYNKKALNLYPDHPVIIQNHHDLLQKIQDQTNI